MKSNNKFYTSDDLYLFRFAKNWKKYFSSKISSYIKGDVLEVGAGIGSNTSFLLENSKNVLTWTFAEPEKNFIETLKEISNNLSCNSRVYNSKISHIDGKFDTILYIDVLEHIPDARKEIIDVKSKLKPNGTLIILVPAYNFLYSSFDKAVGHQKRYNKKLLLSEVTLEKIDLFYLDSIGLIASIANKFLLKKDMPSKSNILFWDRVLIRLSLFFDKVINFSVGKSLIGIFKN